MSEGVATHRQGRLDQAIDQYLRALRERPNRSLASYNLGVAFIDAGLGLTSMPFLRRAAMLQPASEVFGDALFLGLTRSGRLEDARRFVEEREGRGLTPAAVTRWRRRLAEGAADADPASPNLAETTHEFPDRAPALPTVSAPHADLQGPFAKALEDYQAARMETLIADLEPLVAEHPDWGEGHHLLGLGLMALGRFDRAALSLGLASQWLPGRAELWDHLGVACARLNDEDGLRNAFEHALSLNPLRAETWNNAADSSMSRGRLDEAFQYALQALRLKPDLFESKDCLLQAAYRIEREQVARGAASDGGKGVLATAVRAVRAGVDSPEQSLALAPLLVRVGQFEQVVEILEESLERFGDRPPHLLNDLVFNQRHVCDWRHWHERLPALIKRIRRDDGYVATPFSALSIPGLAPADLLKVARRRAEDFRPWSARAGELRPAAPKAAGSRLRIGYLSADFQDHATAYLTASIFERHDRDRFEVFAYSSEPDDGGRMRQRLLKAFEHFVDIHPLNHLEAAQRIRDDGVDILVDLKGYTRNARPEILALRPSPIQVTWLGFPGGMGAPFIDYMIVDPVVVPPDQAPHYDEALAYLPDAYAPVDDHRQVAAIPTRADAGLPESGFVFCCFNDPYKITPDLFGRWCDLLKAVPGSLLWLYAKTGRVTENLQREAADRGVAPERLVFAGKVPQAEHLARIALADLVLDTLPYNAHTTSSDALWMGVPVLTCMGETFAARVAASLLTASGLADLVTTDLDDYQARALWLATHPGNLASIKQRLAAAKDSAAFFDASRFTRNLEAIYQRIWDLCEQGRQPSQLAPMQV